MRDAASRTRSHNSSARNESTNSAQGNPEISQQESRQSRRDEDLAGAAVASQQSNSESPAAQGGAKPDTASSQAQNGSEKQEGHVNSEAKGAGLELTKSEKEQLQSNLKAALQILEQTPAGRELASELQDVLRGNALASTDAGELAPMRLSEAQAQKLQEKLQDIFAALKQMNKESPLNDNIKDTGHLKSKLSDLLALVEQAMRRNQQSSQEQTLSQLRQPEVVEGFVLRAEKDRESFNTAAKVDDPRFAALLNKTTDFSSLRERQGQQNGQHTDVLPARLSGLNPQEQAQSLIQQARTEIAATKGESEASVDGQARMGTGVTATSGSAAADLMGMKGVADPAGTKDNAAVDFSGVQKGTGIGNNSTDPGIMSLKNGATMPTARVVDQTIQHLNLHARGDSSVVTVKLYPEELGELNIRMVMEGDQLKLQIQAQNQQVREILEQNFPRLRTAMEDQGVTVEDFQVSLGDSSAEDQAGAQSDDELSRRRETGGSTRIADVDVDASESADSPGKALSAGGLSVHV